MVANTLRTGQIIAAHGKLWEAKASTKLGARLRPASGAMAQFKGDFVSIKGRPLLYEAKSTTSASLPIKLEWLVKLTEEAQCLGKTPVLAFGFVLPTGRPQPNCNAEWCAVPLPVFKEMLEAINSNHSKVGV